MNQLDKTRYKGNELELFEQAINWKKYYFTFLKPYLKGKVLEVGAGIGGSTVSLCDGTQDKWICLEPDIELANRIEIMIKNNQIPDCCRVMAGSLIDIPITELFDVIIYIDVIEHIENDKKELELAAEHLTHNGLLIILVPAHQWLFSPFDKAIGHYRRYNKKMLTGVVPSHLMNKKLIYLDSVGLLSSIGNRLFLKKEIPNETQIKIWDKILVRLSSLFDHLINFSIGKSILGIWENPNNQKG